MKVVKHTSLLTMDIRCNMSIAATIPIPCFVLIVIEDIMIMESPRSLPSIRNNAFKMLTLLATLNLHPASIVPSHSIFDLTIRSFELCT